MEAVHPVLTPRIATPWDEDTFKELWVEYLQYLEKNGSILPANEETLGMFVDLFRQITGGGFMGLALIVPGVAASLWGPVLAVPTIYGKTIQGQGTYVRPAYRGRGVAARIYRDGFGILRSWGIQAFVGSVDQGNALGAKNARRLHAKIVQQTEIVEL